MKTPLPREMGVSRLPAQSDMSRKQAKMQTISPKSQTSPFSQIISPVKLLFFLQYDNTTDDLNPN
jgi:hypothetical protein